jgi:hypothetical protein
MAIQINGDSGISGVNGSAGTPALQGTDSNTGIVFGTDTVQVATGGSTRVTVDSSGNVTTTGSATFGSTVTAQDGASGVTTSANDVLTIEATDVTSKTRGLGIYGKSSITSSFEAFQLRHGANQNITFKYDGSASFAGGAFAIASDGDISTNIRGHGHLELDSTGSFGSPKVKLFGNTGNATFAGDVSCANDKVKLVTSSAHGLIQVKNSSNVVKINLIGSDGSATFAGAVTSTTTAKAWIQFNGTGSVAIRAHFNVASLTDNGTGDYTITFTTAMADANYAVVGMTSEAGNPNRMMAQREDSTIVNTSVRVGTFTTGGTVSDELHNSVVVFR